MNCAFEHSKCELEATTKANGLTMCDKHARWYNVATERWKITVFEIAKKYRTSDLLMQEDPDFQNEEEIGPIPDSLDDFEETVGHRFRRTKDQTNRGLSREDAFKEWKTIRRMAVRDQEVNKKLEQFS